MSLELKREDDGLFVVTVGGILEYSEMKKLESSGIEINADSPQAKILILAGKFTGWGKEGDWGDLAFMYEHDPYIEKIAVVADQKWKQQLLMFLGEGRRNASIEFFLSDEVEDALYWLSEN